MIPYHKTNGIILKSRSYGETDKLVTIYTRSFGKINAIAKGARKSKSKFGSSFEVFSESRLFMYKKEYGELYLVTQTEIANSFKNIAKDLDKFCAASTAAELVYGFTPFSEKNISLYNFLHFVLNLIDRTDYGDKVLLMFMVKFLTLSGYGMNLRSCSSCGKDEKQCAGPGRLQLSAKYGGILCNECAHKDSHGIKILNGTLKLLEYLQTKPFDNLKNITIDRVSKEEIERSVLLFLGYHFERDLKSINIVKKLLGV